MLCRVVTSCVGLGNLSAGSTAVLDRPASPREHQRSERNARWRDRQRRGVAVMNLDVALLLR
jgi:hypothetical protein